MTYIAFLWIFVILLTTYLPFLTFLGIMVSFARRKSRKRSFIALIIAVFILYHMNGNGQNIENLIERLHEGSFAAAFLLIGYLYLMYWWSAFLHRRSKEKKEFDFLKKEDLPLERAIKKGKRDKIFTVTLTIVLVLSIPFIAFVYPRYIKEKSVIISQSLMNMSKVEIVQEGKLLSLCGEQGIKVYYEKEGNPRYSFRIKIDYEGKNVKPETFNVYWQDENHASLIIKDKKNTKEIIAIDLLNKMK
ncbi:hypothetical protein [Priestia endophytica]|uniref:hypothetical protein n=1 Tax=Priestia endophytica TaxID=135735 RepID=UPI000DCA587D|nr:hypothetical protein [Priestia endophytica]RAS76833.1 hypothetical protein A4R27_20095 [Priestia endophytica]